MIVTKYFVHIGLAVLSLLAGVFQIVYCCIFFTSGMGVWNGALLLGIGV
jgi:hypothetical protein